ncbi:MAG: UDP-glucose 4-epimerase GalE [Methylophaga sp.]|nr:MAG: UDP-glucose 4-epimerase GalE [Methylophaga sp.]
MKVLVLGGAGYIGSHMCKYLSEQGHEVVVFDNLSTGHAEAVKWGVLVKGDILNQADLDMLFEIHGRFDLIMHFCAKSLVGESVQQPAIYYKNNVVGTLNVLDTMVKTGHDKLVFSSTAAVFGMPQVNLIDEKQPRRPINPYGQTKKMVEDILQDYHQAYGLKSVCLRYFNACGADPECEVGECHQPETHLIPNVLKSVNNASSAKLKVFGNDYPTADGTCVRDYIHINDLATAHIKAGLYLDNHDGAYAFNLGNGNGFSVLQVINAAMAVVGEDIAFDIEARRQGDPAILVADASLAIKQLGWQPKYTDITDIIATAWQWHQNEKF